MLYVPIILQVTQEFVASLTIADGYALAKDLMNSKLIVGALVGGALLAGMLAYHRAHPITAEAAQPASPAAPPAPVAVTAAAPAVAEAEPAGAVEAKITQSLKGKDFSLRVSVNGNDSYRNLEVEMDDGTPIRLLRSVDGQTGSLDNTTFAPNDKFELVNLFSGEPREQIVCRGDQWLSRGEGELDTYSIYRIEGDHLQELLSVITKRDREEGNGPPPQKLDAQVEQTTRDGTPAVIYRVKKANDPEQTIVFLWNGKRFEDASGAYQKIADEYSP